MRRKTEVGEIQIAMAAAEGVALTVLKHLRNGEIHGAIACFAEEFTFKDQGIGLEFKDKKHLSEFFWKTRELSPDYSWETDAYRSDGEREARLLGRLLRLTSRRSGLAAHFEEWVEL